MCETFDRGTFKTSNRFSVSSSSCDDDLRRAGGPFRGAELDVLENEIEAQCRWHVVDERDIRAISDVQEVSDSRIH